MIEHTLGRLSAGEDLSMDEMSRSVEAIMLGLCSEAEIALLLTGLRLKGETAAEIAGAAVALRKQMTPIRSRRPQILDTCGTGGDGARTFNISTCAALVAAAAGATVAKHGNRRITSSSGSADVLTALGVNVQASVETVEACLDELGICFCFAPLLHAAMKHVSAVRQQLGVPTIFNLLGPLSNPAGACYQLLGVSRQPLRETMAEVLSLLGTTHSLVVCGDDGLDEITLSGVTHVSEVKAGSIQHHQWHPRDFGVEPSGLECMLVANAEQSAAIIRTVLSGERGPPREIVVLNAAAALWTAEKDVDLKNCARMASDAIDRGTARALLDKLVNRTNAVP